MQLNRDLSIVTCYNYNKKRSLFEFLSRTVKKLAAVLITFILMTATSIDVFLLAVPITENPVETSATSKPTVASQTPTLGIDLHLLRENIKAPLPLQYILCIYYPVQFKKDQKVEIHALINSYSEINIKTLAYTMKLGFYTQKTDVGTQKIDGFSLTSYRMIIVGF